MSRDPRPGIFSDFPPGPSKKPASHAWPFLEFHKCCGPRALFYNELLFLIFLFLLIFFLLFTPQVIFTHTLPPKKQSSQNSRRNNKNNRKMGIRQRANGNLFLEVLKKTGNL
jgi:hypothetical protein